MSGNESNDRSSVRYRRIRSDSASEIIRRLRILLPIFIFAGCLSTPVRSRSDFSVTVSFAPSVTEKPFTGRIFVFFGPPDGREPRYGPDWFSPGPFYAKDVKNLKPGEKIVFTGETSGFPGMLSRIAPGRYAAQALMDREKDYGFIGDAPGDAASAMKLVSIDPDDPDRLDLRIDRTLPAKRFEETPRVKLVDIPSRLLSRFFKRPIRMRAGVLLPTDYEERPDRRYPTVYHIPGFGGDERGVREIQGYYSAEDALPAIHVVLDPTCYWGHHVFADSANDGPRGKALIREMIPFIEKTYRCISKPEARFLMGHSSGGWSVLWLQVTYPDFFDGVWSLSPDPVDFRDFLNVDLYAPGANLFRDADGNPRPIARMNGKPVLFIQPFSDMESVLGHGGQLMSFEAVFSPRGKDGKPARLYDRETGAVDPVIAKAWRRYDIDSILRRDGSKLRTRLRGKLHIYVGSEDTFYLDGAAKLLKSDLERLGSDAVVEIQPGKDHSSILTRALFKRIDDEMKARFRRADPADSETEASVAPLRTAPAR